MPGWRPCSPPDFDVNRFNLTQTRKYDGLALDELIERFRAVRHETIRIVREMKEEDLDREGVHAFHGKGKLDRFIRWAYEHARLHEDDIHEALKNLLNCDRICHNDMLNFMKQDQKNPDIDHGR